MDIAYVSNVVYPFVTGGAEKRIHEIGKRLAARGHKITIYGRKFWDGPSEITYQGLRFRGVSPPRELYVDNGRRSISEALEFSKDLLVPLYRRADEHDVIVASVFPYFPVITTKLTLIRRRTPLVTTWHEVWQEYWDEYLGRLAPFGKAVELATAQIPQYPVAVSNMTANRLANLGQYQERIKVVPNGIDISQINQIDPVTNGFDVLFAGRLIEDKNVDLLIKSFNILSSKHDIQLGIIGEGPELSYLKNLTQNLDLHDRVTFLGFLDDYEDVLAHMQAADIFASPSIREGFGITYAEAMAADCIVLAADHPDSAASEVINQGGFTVPPTISSITSKLDEIVQGQRPVASPQETATKFDWDRITDQALIAYHEAINSK